MSTAAIINARRKAAGLPLIRFSIRKLQPADIQDLRDAYAAMYEISNLAAGDQRGYWAIARGHGYDQDLCHNDSRIFLTWHRGYIYVFEKALNTALRWKRKDPNIVLTLPYWDWTTYDPKTDAPNGIPKAINDPTYRDASGKVQPNPLASARSMYRVNSLRLTGDKELTQRYPTQLRANIPAFASDVARYMKLTDHMEFSNDFNNGAHGGIHVYTGGTNAASPLPGRTGDMGQVISAAYDPIFWLHHSMVDKVWFDWQAVHGNSTVPQHVLDTVVYGNLVGRDVIDATRSLMYIYSTEEVSASEQFAATDAEPSPKTLSLAASAPVVDPKSKVLSLPIGKISDKFRRAQLDFHSLRPPKQSFELRAFINNKKASAKTSLKDSTFAGRLVLFGHGECFGAPGHCNPEDATRDEYDLRPQHPLRHQKTRYAIDITEALKRLTGKGSANVEITIVTLDAEGDQVAPNSVEHAGVSLTTNA